jgi:hypothetical protein
LLANIYLHYVLDLLAERWRWREATGDMIIVRHADDFIVGFDEGSACWLGSGRVYRRPRTQPQDSEASAEGDAWTQAVAGGSEAVVG